MTSVIRGMAATIDHFSVRAGLVIAFQLIFAGLPSPEDGDHCVGCPRKTVEGFGQLGELRCWFEGSGDSMVSDASEVAAVRQAALRANGTIGAAAPERSRSGPVLCTEASPLYPLERRLRGGIAGHRAERPRRTYAREDLCRGEG